MKRKIENAKEHLRSFVDRRCIKKIKYWSK